MDETLAHEPNPERDRAQLGGRFVYSSGDRPLEGYTIKRAIGRGGFGEVYYGITDAGKEVALKLITRNLEVERRGVMHCMNLKSPHLITIHDLRDNDEGDSFVIMEYVSGPSLEHILRRHPGGMPQEEVRSWLKGLVDGVAYLHDHGVVHRDLKPANLFLEEGVVKIGDYGLSKSITSSKEPGHSQSVGTCHYMAPEIGTGKYHKPIDIYAIGVILYEMLTGRVPFDGESVHEVLMKHLTARPDLTAVPEPFRNIVARALAKDPNQRPARVTDLLLPGDAPREPDLRFITDNKSAKAGSSALYIGDEPPPAARPEEDVLRIGPDDSILYIGPDTRPPAPRRGLGRLIRAAAPRTPRPASPPPAARRPASSGAQGGVHRAVASRPAPPPAPEARRPQPAPAPPPTPPTPPGPVAPRVRVAELAGSMLLAAPLAAFGTLLSVPIFEIFNARHPQTPDELALVFAATLLGSWGVLAQNKAWEVRPARRRRLLQFGLGLVLGLIVAALTAWAHLGMPRDAFDTPATSEFVQASAGTIRPEAVPALALGGYFAPAFAANGFWKLTARDRKARFRFLPVVLATALGGVIGAVVPSPQPWGAIVVGLVAAVVQLSSPWSREAAAYARYREAIGRRRAG